MKEHPQNYSHRNQVCIVDDDWTIMRETTGEYSIEHFGVELDRAVSFEIAYSLLQVYKKDGNHIQEKNNG